MITPSLTLNQVHEIAVQAHAGQFDKIGVPYIRHVEAVSAGLQPFGEELQMAGLLHDIIEDTSWTASGLLSAGVPRRVVRLVEAVTNVPGGDYLEKIRKIARDPSARLLKIADNLHNSRPDRAAQLPPEKRERFAERYRKAREILWADAAFHEVMVVATIVNGSLLQDVQRFFQALEGGPR